MFYQRVVCVLYFHVLYLCCMKFSFFKYFFSAFLKIAVSTFRIYVPPFFTLTKYFLLFFNCFWFMQNFQFTCCKKLMLLLSGYMCLPLSIFLFSIIVSIYFRMGKYFCFLENQCHSIHNALYCRNLQIMEYMIHRSLIYPIHLPMKLWSWNLLLFQFTFQLHLLHRYFF